MPRTPQRERPRADRSRGSASLGRNTAWALAAEVVKLATSVGTFLLVAWFLGPSDYGVYVGTLGLMWFLLPFASFGAAYLLLQRVAGEGMDLEEALGRANAAVVVGGAVSVVGLCLARPLVLPQSPPVVLALLALSEIVFGGAHDVAVFASQATDQLRLSVVLRLLQGVSRCLAAIALVIVDPAATLTEWAWLHLATAAFAAVAAQMMLRVGGRQRIPLRRLKLQELRQGLPYSVGFGADKLRESADTMLLLRIGTSTDAGLYGAALRLVNIAVIPLRALIASSNARFFAAGATSTAAANSVARRVTVAGLAYAIVATAGIAIAGPATVSLLSDEYATAGDALRLLAAWPIAVSLEAFVATAITATGHQRIRVFSTMMSTAIVVGLNLWLIPGHGWRGSVIASFAASTVNAIVLWSALTILAKRAHRGRMSHRTEPSDAETD